MNNAQQQKRKTRRANRRPVDVEFESVETQNFWAAYTEVFKHARDVYNDHKLKFGTVTAVLWFVVSVAALFGIETIFVLFEFIKTIIKQ